MEFHTPRRRNFHNFYSLPSAITKGSVVDFIPLANEFSVTLQIV